MRFLPRSFQFYYIAIVIGLVPTMSLDLAAQITMVDDSSMKKLSVEELVKLRKLLAKQRDQLFEKQKKSREQGVEITEEFLDKTKEENANQDKILIRVAEYYIEQEDLGFEKRFGEYDRAYEEYERQLKLYEEGTLKIPPVEPTPPKRNYDDAVSIYNMIISNFPESDLIDEAYYNKAFLLNKMGQDSVAEKIFRKVIDQYPESPYAPEAYMQLAESYFYPEPGDSREETILNLKKSNQLYQNILAYKASPRYDEALYKLGWSYYRLAGDDPDYYTDAIVYFMAVIKDIERTKELDPTGEIVLTDVEPEAIEYIAASFTDTAYSKSGVDNCSQFIQKLGKPDFGKRIMEDMGDRYAKITLWDNSRRAYRELLDLYPTHAYAPRIQKKVADSYVAEGELDRAFEERELLFEAYNPKSEWYAQLEQRDFTDRITAIDEAYRMSEEALRTNVLYLYNLAKDKEEQEESPTELYNQFCEVSRLYLNNFPTDTNAYDINWSLALILDTKLDRFHEAFEEYIRVSNDYLEDENRFNAAINAIAVADTLAQIDTALVDTTVVQGIEIQRLPAKELTEEEKMLAEAYDNFIKLFPASAETPEILASAGALYYNHRQFDLAKKYYKTMVTKFPEAQQKNIGLISLMNSYFFLGQYRDAEIVARKILEVPNIPPDQVENAKKKLGQSIYKNAEKLEQEGNYVEAAKEYVRVYEDASEYIDFADRALFKGAYNYEQAGEWQQAINTYRVLVDNIPESEHVLPALGNIAEDYKELEDYTNVGRTYEQIFDRFPGTDDAETALFNASLFYAKAEEWQEAIRANDLYIANYPENPEAKDLLFENAKYYLKLDDLASANKIYEDFALKYPNDPRTVEAFYNRGNYYFEQGQYDLARAEFNRAIQKSDEFARTGQDPNLFYAAEANYKLGEILYEQYKAIQLSYPPSRLRTQLQQKSSLLEQVRTAFTRVIELGSLRGFEAMYKIAEAYEELANSIANQQLPPNLNREQQLVERNRVFEASVTAYDQAVEEYKSVIINIPKLAEKLDVSLEKDTSEVEPQLATVADTSGIIQKEAEKDSTAEVARKWYNLAKTKVSSIEYEVAERSSDFITAYLRTPNPETGLKAIVYDGLLLQNVIEPRVQTTIQAHLKNLQVSEELSLENKYVEESKRKILLTSNVTADEYANVFQTASELYVNSVPTLEDLVERGSSATTPEGMDYFDYQDYIMQLIFQMNKSSKAALNHYVRTLQFAREHNIQNDARLTTEENITNFAYEAGNKMSIFADSANKMIDRYLDQFDETGNQNYQLASSFFDDQAIELSTYSQEVFELAYNLSKEYEIENIWTQLILAKLVELDPSSYLADLPREEQSFASDTTWLASTLYEPGWNYEEYDDSAWQNAVRVASPPTLQFQVFDSLGISPAAIWAAKTIISERKKASASLEMEEADILEPEQQEMDTLETQAQLQDTALAASTADTLTEEPDTLTANFRKEFELSSLPVEGKIAITGDKTYRCYLNDIYIIGVDHGDFEKVELVPFEAFGDELKVGKNILACSVTDVDGPPRYGLRFQMMLEFLPIELSDAVQKVREGQQQDIDREQLRQVVILNKNRIIK